MQATVLTTAAGTTTEDPKEPLQSYYQGQFLSIRNLIEGFPEEVKTDLYFADKEYGIADSSETYAAVRSTTPVGSETMIEKSQLVLKETIPISDIVVILLTRDAFGQIVTPIWAELVEKARSDSIWCLGTARSALEDIDLESLETGVDHVITYRRRGVARIGTEQKTALQEEIAQRLSD
jgi:hypothetical protein